MALLAEEIEECGADLADAGHRFLGLRRKRVWLVPSNNGLNGRVKHSACGAPTAMRNGRIRRRTVPNSTTPMMEMI